MSECAHVRDELGALVLEGLDADEAAAVEAHLEGCAACRAEHAELAVAPRLLALAADAPPAVPPRVRDRIVAAATRRRSRRRWSVAVAAAATVAALAGVTVGWLLAPPAPPEIAVPLEAEEPFGDASGWAVFRAGEDHTIVRLELDGLEPLSGSAVYEAWMYTPDERIVSIGQLGDTVDEPVELTARGSLEDYRGFWVTAEPDWRDPGHEGPTVLRAAVPEPR